MPSGRIDAGRQPGHPVCSGQVITGPDKTIKGFPCVRPRPHRPELDVTSVITRFRTGTQMADRQTIYLAPLPQEQRVPEAVPVHCSDFLRQIQPLEDLIRHPEAGADEFPPDIFSNIGIPDICGIGPCFLDGPGHEGREETRPESASLVQSDMFLTGSKGEESHM